MNEGQNVFSQLIAFLPDRDFRRCVASNGGDRYVKRLSCWNQFLAMAFCAVDLGSCRAAATALLPQNTATAPFSISFFQRYYSVGTISYLRRISAT
jgi:hypothetical protein